MDIQGSAAAPRSKQEVLVTDGSGLVLECPAPPGREARWAFRAWVTHRVQGTRVIGVGDAGVAVGSPLPDATVVAEARTKDGATVYALADPSPEAPAITTYVYQSTYHELYTAQAGRGVPLEAFLDFLRPLAIADTPDGLVVRPRAASGVQVELQFGSTVVNDVACVDTYFGPSQRRALPAHRGRRSFGGELWRIEGNELLLANETTVSRITPDLAPAGANAGTRFTDLVDNLRLTRVA